MGTVPAARDTLRVIRLLAARSGPVRAATIARELGLPRSSTYQLLRTLQDEGFVIHSPEHQGYALGALLGEIGSSVLASNTLARLAGPVLERLVAETKRPLVAHLGLLQHDDVVYASKIAAARAPAVVTSIGVRLPAHLTATGRSMLAALPPAQFEAIYSVDAPLPRRTSHGPSTTAELQRMLEETRERGWATEDGDITLPYASVAAPVLDHNDYPAASVGLTFRGASVDDAERMRLGRAVRSAAETLSRRIRGRA
ncbi:IclR family transcriptional regulator [Homoserinimonas aerilata]|uniref:Glycerol operon regulatory protein n=1 Tax=Homoserinimonas aerilata TaxID=1162970 RepID=A0A542YHZ1_9MICO|nr:IclR family transcriptional regulator [Homoserinimonas aerilata]TQL47727.1 IclR family transcriptional regulator [Homoserinimonas aerilata]